MHIVGPSTELQLCSNALFFLALCSKNVCSSIHLSCCASLASRATPTPLICLFIVAYY